MFRVLAALPEDFSHCVLCWVFSLPFALLPRTNLSLVAILAIFLVYVVGVVMRGGMFFEVLINPHSKSGPVNLGLGRVDFTIISSHLLNEMLDLAYVPALPPRVKHFVSCSSPSAAVISTSALRL